MKFWTKDETIAWLASNELGADSNEPMLNDAWKKTCIDIPTTSLEQAKLSRAIFSEMKPDDLIVFSLTERTLCSDDEDPVIIERIRLSYGEERGLDQAPTFLCGPGESEAACALLRLFLMFCWDGYLINSRLSICVRFYGHEGCAFVYRR